jgi:hypothetical protein
MRLHRLHHASSSVIHIRWADPATPPPPLLAPQATAVTLDFGVNVHTRGCSESGADRYIERKICALNVRIGAH